MKKQTQNLSYGFLLSCLFLLLLWSCNDDNEVRPVSVTVKISYPSNYLVVAGTGIEGKLTSTTGGPEYTGSSSATGEILFPSVIPGAYNLTATQALDASQSLAVTGKFKEAITLNGQANVTVLAGTPEQVFNQEISGVPAGNLMFKEVSYTGVPNFYFSDQFVEIYNNTKEVIYLDGLCIADIHGASGQINSSTAPTPFQSDASHVYANSVWQIPGSGEQHPLPPGQSIIIAQDGINHTEQNANSTVNLSTANWETYNQRDDNRDIDSPTVPNLTRLYFTGGFDWLVPVFGPGLVIFRTNNFASLEQVAIPGAAAGSAPRIKIPTSLVIDAFEALRDAESGTFKRIPASLDAGFVFASNTYTGESFRRKLAVTTDGRKILQDTNNSTNDFEKLTKPTPKQLP
jgi:Protein of unknown function (DUF4876)